MSKRLDELSMDLASGMSRRKALWRFLAGSGAALFMLRKKAKASGNDACVALCMSLSQSGFFQNSDAFFGQCVSAAAQCPDGQCAVPFTVNGSIQPGTNYRWVCCPVG